jgi:hypothetical protein
VDDAKDPAMDPTDEVEPRSDGAASADRLLAGAASNDSGSKANGAPTREEMTIALTPGQMAVGGAIIAGLLVVGARLVLGRRRGRR